MSWWRAASLASGGIAGWFVVIPSPWRYLLAIAAGLVALAVALAITGTVLASRAGERKPLRKELDALVADIYEWLGTRDDRRRPDSRVDKRAPSMSGLRYHLFDNLEAQRTFGGRIEHVTAELLRHGHIETAEVSEIRDQAGSWPQLRDVAKRLDALQRRL